MSPLSRGGAHSCVNVAASGSGLLRHFLVGTLVWLHLVTRHCFAISIAVDGVSKMDRSTTKSPNSPEEIEAFVKALEYEAANGGTPNDLVKIDLNLLDGDVIEYEVQDGLQEEFEAVDEALGETPPSPSPFPSPSPPPKKEKPGPTSRQMSLIYQGVYAPDSRFNPFADGVMVNMVAEMKRKKMDPLYFRVYDRGIVQHVSTGPGSGREGRGKEQTSESSSSDDATPTARQGRQRGNAIGGGVIRGLTNTKRFGNAEVQIAGNTTLVRCHYVHGPLNIELVYNTEKGVKTINSTLDALATHTVAGLKDNSSKLIDFLIDSPSDYEVHLVGARSRKYQRLSQSAIMRLFKPTGTLERRLKQQYARSRARRIPDITRRRNRSRGRGNKSGSNTKNKTDNATVPDPELP